MKMYKLHNNVGLVRGHALLQIRNVEFLPERQCHFTNYWHASISFSWYVDHLSIIPSSSFDFNHRRWQFHHICVKTFFWTFLYQPIPIYVTHFFINKLLITELTWTSPRGTRVNARNTNKSSRSSKQRKCGQRKEQSSTVAKRRRRRKESSSFGIPTSSIQRQFFQPESIFPPRLGRFSARAASNLVPIHRLYHPLPPLSKLVLVQPQPWSIAPSSSPFSFCASRRGACARKRREASASCRGRRTNVVGQPTDRPSRPSVLLSARPVSSREPSRGLFQSFHPQSAPTLLFPIPSVHNTHRTQRPAAPRARVSPLREAACSSTAARPSPPRVGRRKMGRTPRATRAGSIAK